MYLLVRDAVLVVRRLQRPREAAAAEFGVPRLVVREVEDLLRREEQRRGGSARVVALRRKTDLLKDQPQSCAEMTAGTRTQREGSFCRS